MTSFTNPPLPSREGGSVSRQRLVTLLAILPWALLLFQFLFVLPRYERIFRQFAFKVDDYTSLLIRISEWSRSHALIAFLITFVAMIVNVVASVLIQTKMSTKKRRATALLIIYGVPCVLFLLAWVGVLATHRRLIGELQN